jgi:hypothetical protein
MDFIKHRKTKSPTVNDFKSVKNYSLVSIALGRKKLDFAYWNTHTQQGRLRALKEQSP